MTPQRLAITVLLAASGVASADPADQAPPPAPPRIRYAVAIEVIGILSMRGTGDGPVPAGHDATTATATVGVRVPGGWIESRVFVGTHVAYYQHREAVAGMTIGLFPHAIGFEGGVAYYGGGWGKTYSDESTHATGTWSIVLDGRAHIGLARHLGLDLAIGLLFPEPTGLFASTSLVARW